MELWTADWLCQLGHDPRQRSLRMTAIDVPRFVVVGAFVADCIVETPRLPVWGETYEARSIRTSPGGKGLNQAVALSRLGAHVTAVGAVGNDPLGRDIRDTLDREGVDTWGVQLREEVQTPICVCLVGDDGRTSFVWHIAEGAATTPKTIEGATPAIEQADAVLVTFEVPPPAVRDAIHRAHRRGATVVVNPAPPLRHLGEVATLPWDRVDLVVPNEAEGQALLANGHSSDHAERGSLAGTVAQALTVPKVVVTLGDAGCVSYSLGNSCHHPAHQGDRVVDTTGASDAFTASLAFHLASHMPEHDAIQTALSAAAWTVSRPGGYDSMPTRAVLATSFER